MCAVSLKDVYEEAKAVHIVQSGYTGNSSRLKSSSQKLKYHFFHLFTLPYVKQDKLYNVPFTTDITENILLHPQWLEILANMDEDSRTDKRLNRFNTKNDNNVSIHTY